MSMFGRMKYMIRILNDRLIYHSMGYNKILHIEPFLLTYKLMSTKPVEEVRTPDCFKGNITLLSFVLEPVSLGLWILRSLFWWFANGRIFPFVEKIYMLFAELLVWDELLVLAKERLLLILLGDIEGDASFGDLTFEILAFCEERWNFFFNDSNFSFICISLILLVDFFRFSPFIFFHFPNTLGFCLEFVCDLFFDWTNKSDSSSSKSGRFSFCLYLLKKDSPASVIVISTKSLLAFKTFEVSDSRSIKLSIISSNQSELILFAILDSSSSFFISLINSLESIRFLKYKYECYLLNISME